jgi:RAD51-like protein 2
MNQMTRKVVVNKDGIEEGIFIPALGDSWGHACTNRVILYWAPKEFGQDHDERRAWLCKSNHLPDKVVGYVVTVIHIHCAGR